MIDIVTKKNRRNEPRWKGECDNTLRKYLNDGFTDQQIAILMNFSVGTVSVKRKALNLPANKLPIGNGCKELGGFIPDPRPNPLREAEKYIPGFNSETMCIHYPNNRLERITLHEAVRIVNERKKKQGVKQIDYLPEWVV